MKKIKNLGSPFLLFIFLYTVCHSAPAQKVMMTKYFDSTWNNASKDAAFYYTEMVKRDTVYHCTSYWTKSKKLNCISTYADTLFAKPIGMLVRYYENGKTQDSTYFYENGIIKNNYHYYPDGKLWVQYSYNLKNKTDITKAYDPNGDRIDDFVYMREASFGDDAGAWSAFLAENVKTKVPVKNKAPLGTYQVIIKFIVGTNGKVESVEPETNFGYGMEAEVMRVVNKSPKWTPALLMGKAVKAYRRQPLIFMVTE